MGRYLDMIRDGDDGRKNSTDGTSDSAKEATRAQKGNPEIPATVLVQGVIAIQHDGERLTIEDLLPYAPLPLAECQACHRRYYWRVVPKVCPWRGCGGTLAIVKQP